MLPDTGITLINPPMKVIDNFLPIDVFQYIQEQITSPGTAWYFKDSVAAHTDDMSFDNYMHSHMVYENHQPCSSMYEELLPLVEHPKLKVKSLLRILVNSYPHTNKILKHDDHVDFDYSHKGAILYLNTCNGYTYCEGEKVFSVANRLLLHDPSKLHHSTTTSNEQRRLICNVNYL